MLYSRDLTLRTLRVLCEARRGVRWGARSACLLSFVHQQITQSHKKQQRLHDDTERVLIHTVFCSAFALALRSPLPRHGCVTTQPSASSSSSLLRTEAARRQACHLDRGYACGAATMWIISPMCASWLRPSRPPKPRGKERLGRTPGPPTSPCAYKRVTDELERLFGAGK